MKKLIYTGMMSIMLCMAPLAVKAQETSAQAVETAKEEEGGIDHAALVVISLSVISAGAVAISKKKK